MYMTNRFFLKIKRKFLNKKLKLIGENAYIHYSVHIKNPGYIEIGDGVLIGSNGIIEAWDTYNDKHFSPRIVIGNETKINSFCHIGAINQIEIGKECLLGSHVMIIDHAHGNNSLQESEIHPARRDLFSKGKIVIGDRVWIGENAVVLPGVSIGECSIIGANAVVTHDIPAYSVAAGVPAKVIKTIE